MRTGRILVWAVLVATLARSAPNYQSALGSVQVEATALDASGNLYVAGWTFQSSFSATPGAFQTSFIASICGYVDPPGTSGPPGMGSPIQCPHAVVAKIDSTGTKLLYATFLEGEGDDKAMAITADSAGNAYVTGITSSEQFPITAGAWQTSGSGGVVAKLSPDGGKLLFSSFIPGGSGSAIKVDSQGNVFVAGSTSGDGTFPTTSGAFQTLASANDAFVVKLNSTGTAALYSTLIGGTFNDYASALAIDAEGNVLIAGYTNSIPVYANRASNFVPYPMTLGAFNAPNDLWDVFVTKLNATGTALIYSSVFGGSGSDFIESAALDSSGAAYVGGFIDSKDFPLTAGVVQTIPGRGFISKLSADGSTLEYSTYLTGAVSSIVPDIAGDAFITGTTLLPNLPTTPAALMPCFPATGPGAYGVQYPYVMELNPTATTMLYASYSNLAPVGNNGTGTLYFPGSQAIYNAVNILAPPEPGLRCIANAATYLGPPLNVGANTATNGFGLAPGEIVTLLGPVIGPSEPATGIIDSTGKISTSNQNTRVLFGGVAAPLLYVAPNQINAVVPFEVAGQTQTTVTIERNGVAGAPVAEPVVAAAAGIFTLGGSGFGPAAVLNHGGTVNSAANPAPQGSTVSFFVTGAGEMNPAPVDGFIPLTPFAAPFLPVTLTIGGAPPSEVTYIGDAPGLVEGVVQINAIVPALASTGPQPVTLAIGESFTPFAPPDAIQTLPVTVFIGPRLSAEK